MKTRWQFWAALVLCASAAFVAKAQPIANDKPHYAAEISIFGYITDESATHTAGQIIAACADPGTDPILLVINSDGGDIPAGGMIIDAMQQCTHPVHTLCIEHAQSMAFIIFEYGQHRAMWPRAFLMTHNAFATFRGTLPQIQSQLAMIQPYVSEYEHHVAERAGLSFERYRALANDIWYLRAKDAVEAHLADEVTQ